jgi:hypothetical protein
MSMTALLRATVCALVCTLAACGGSGPDNTGSSTSSSTSSSATAASSSSSSATVALSASRYTVAPAAAAVLQVSLTGASAGTTTASYTTSNGTAKAGTDYTATGGTLTWSAGDTAPKTVSIPIARSAAGKTFSIALTSVAGRATFGSPSSAIVTVTGTSATAASLPSSNSSASSSSSSGSSGSSGSSASSVSAQASSLLNYLTGLAGDSRHILTGQHTSYWDSNPLDNIQALYSQTGTYPAILGTTLSMTGSPENGVALANQWISQGGIVLVSLWSDDPAGGVYNAAYSGSKFSDVYTPGNAVNTAWNAYLDKIAAQLKQINGPVLLRPFVELDGNWFWWGRQPTAQFIALWQYSWNRIMVTDGVTNALWVYNVNAYSGNYTAYYPGNSYVDIVSWDSYPPTAIDTLWYNALVGLGKPIILAETGVVSSDNSAVVPYAGNTNDLLQLVKASFPKVVAMVVWCQNAALSEQQGAEAFMTDSAVFNLADLAGAL